MVMQAYDFLELSRRYGCRLQMGGSDQWGNIVNGVELGRRIDGAQLFGLTTPLITTASGAEDGQDRRGRGLAERGPAVDAVRVLAVLAQHRGRRCRPLPAPVHRAAAGRDRAARGARRRRAQRGQEGPGLRGDQAVPGRGGGARSAAGRGSRSSSKASRSGPGTRAGSAKAIGRGRFPPSTSTVANSERA